MLKKIQKWLNDNYDFSEANFKRNWEKGNKDYKKLVSIWKWIALLAFFAGFSLAASIYSQKVNIEVQTHIDNVNEYFFQKYGFEYIEYIQETGQNISSNLTGGLEYDRIT